MRKVMLFGTFNHIHPGHLNMFRQASRHGDRLIVVLARTETVEKLKGYKPFDEDVRKAKLLKIPYVNEVVVGDLQDKFKAIKEIKPEVICLGYDQKFYVDELEKFISENKLDIEIIRLKPYQDHKYKTTKLRKE